MSSIGPSSSLKDTAYVSVSDLEREFRRKSSIVPNASGQFDQKDPNNAAAIIKKPAIDFSAINLSALEDELRRNASVPRLTQNTTSVGKMGRIEEQSKDMPPVQKRNFFRSPYEKPVKPSKKDKGKVNDKKDAKKENKDDDEIEPDLSSFGL